MRVRIEFDSRRGRVAFRCGVALAAAALAVCVPLYASQVGTLITFSPGQTISASAFNSNFTALKVAINDTDNKCGNLTTLTTTAKGDLVSAVNEVNGKIPTGALTSVTTDFLTLNGNGTAATPLAVNFAVGETTYDARYLQLSGGTLTGAINGTGAGFTGSVQAPLANFTSVVGQVADFAATNQSQALTVQGANGAAPAGGGNFAIFSVGGNGASNPAGSSGAGASGGSFDGGTGGDTGSGGMGGTGGQGVTAVGGNGGKGDGATNQGGTGGAGLTATGGTGGTATTNATVGFGGLGAALNGGNGGDAVGTVNAGSGGSGGVATGGTGGASNGNMAGVGGAGFLATGGMGGPVVGGGIGGQGGDGIIATAGPGVGGSPSGFAGTFQGNVRIISAGNLSVDGNTILGMPSATTTVTINGTVNKFSSTFKIDHPLDPQNKLLYHSVVESPDMKNVYDGVVVLDAKGEATVELPSYFEALNKDFRYQLTCVGGAAVVYIADKIHENRFKIAGGREGLEVSWQVTGIRQDAYANAHRIQVEVEKSATERGKLLYPVELGRPESSRIDPAKPTRSEVERPAPTPSKHD
jgi:hypothetical protein